MTEEARKTPRVRDLPIQEELKTSYLTYAMSVIVSRALPDVRDGLKPSQRRVLAAMRDLNLGPRAHFRKCAKICGDTSGNYHPHGEQVIYPTLVRMAQGFNLRYPLVDGQGNFGSIDGDPPAAMRYTEARLTRTATECLEDLDKDSVDLVPNYDETRQEPTVLPARFPNLLCNGSSGIAVGMATQIPPHNLGEIVAGLVALIENPEITVDELAEHVRGPDFPTGAIICGRAGIRSAYRTGRGHLTVRSKVHREEARGDHVHLVITEIPYQVNKTRLIESIAECVKSERIPGIQNIVDESDREGMRIVVKLKRGADDDLALNQLFANTPMQDTFAIQMIALVAGQPRLLDLKEIVECFRDHRIEVIRRRTAHLLRLAEARLHVLEGLLIAIESIDEVIALIKAAASVDDARAGLMARFRLSERQAGAILEMRLARLTGLEREKVQTEHDQVKDRSREYRAILADKNLVLEIIKEDLFELKEKHGDARRTSIEAAVGEFQVEDLIAEENVTVAISHLGYIKREPVRTFRAQRRGGRGVRGQNLRETDFTEHLLIASTHDYLLFFTDRGRVYWLKVYDIPQLGRTARGRAIVNILRLKKNERVTSFVPVRSFDDAHFLFMATRRGTVKRIALTEFSRPRPSGIIALRLADDDALIGVEMTGGDREVLLATRGGQAIRFKETNVRPMGRTAAGVRGARLDEGDEVVSLIAGEPGSHVLTVCARGYGKRSPLESYRLIRRGGRGVININTGTRNGPVIGSMCVREPDEVILMTANGQVVRTRVTEIRVTGRAAKGVRIVALGEGDRIASMARIAVEAVAPVGGEENAAPAAVDAPDEPEETNGIAEADESAFGAGEAQESE